MIAALFALSAYFTYQVEARRRQLSGKRAGAQIASGSKVKAVKAIDGDELSVLYNGSPLVVRLLGIKAFSASANEQDIQAVGAAARRELQRDVETGRELVLEYDTFKQDKHGRVLAYVRSGKKDLAEDLVRRGLVMVYTRYPFKRQARYLTAEAQARAQKLGLWSNPRANLRATALKAVWEADKDK